MKDEQGTNDRQELLKLFFSVVFFLLPLLLLLFLLLLLSTDSIGMGGGSAGGQGVGGWIGISGEKAASSYKRISAPAHPSTIVHCCRDVIVNVGNAESKKTDKNRVMK